MRKAFVAHTSKVIMFKSRLSKILTTIFVFATIMGPGPGLYLVNPSGDDESSATILGMPALYAWAVLWFLVQGAVILVAYKKLWPGEEEGSG